MSICIERSRSSRTSASVPSFVSPENATITRSTSSSETSCGRSSGVPRIVRSPMSVRRLLRIRVDEADDVDAVLGVLQDLAADQLADVACTDDHRVLLIRDAATDDRPRDPAVEGHDQRRGRPQQDDGSDVGRAAERRRDGDHEKRADGEDMEDADQVADRRVVRIYLVPVVEAVELAQRERQHRKQRIPARRLVEHRNETYTDDDADHVGEQERATHEPAAPLGDARASAVREDLDRAVVDHGQEWRPPGDVAARVRTVRRGVALQTQPRSQHVSAAHRVRPSLPHSVPLPQIRGYVVPQAR